MHVFGEALEAARNGGIINIVAHTNADTGDQRFVGFRNRANLAAINFGEIGFDLAERIRTQCTGGRNQCSLIGNRSANELQVSLQHLQLITWLRFVDARKHLGNIGLGNDPVITGQLDQLFGKLKNFPSREQLKSLRQPDVPLPGVRRKSSSGARARLLRWPCG